MSTIPVLRNSDRIGIIRLGIQQLNLICRKLSEVEQLIATYNRQTVPNPGEVTYYANALLTDAQDMYYTALVQLCNLANGKPPTSKPASWRYPWSWTAGVNGVESIQFTATTNLIHVNAAGGLPLGEFSGFEVGDIVTVTGANEAGNNGDHVVTDLGSGGAYIEVSGSTLVNETATSTVVLALKEANDA
jgi:hypothetical protein